MIGVGRNRHLLASIFGLLGAAAPPSAFAGQSMDVPRRASRTSKAGGRWKQKLPETAYDHDRIERADAKRARKNARRIELAHSPNITGIH